MAVLAVVIHHVIVLGVPGKPGGGVLPKVLSGGFLGVDLFFVLSGFLITTLLLEERDRAGRVNLWRFYRRRALRLLPALFVTLLIHAAYAIVARLDWRLEMRTIVAAAFYFLNWQIAWTFQVAEGLGHLWSLAIEEQFYLIWPIALSGLISVARRPAVAAAVLIAVALLIALHRASLFADGVSFGILYVRTDTRMDSLLIGAVLSISWRARKAPRQGVWAAGWVAAAFVLACFIFARFETGTLYRGGFTVVALAMAIVVLASLDNDWPGNRVLGWRPLRAIGIVSYGVYLSHAACLMAFARWGADWPAAVRITVALLCTAIWTLVSWFAVERPFLRWKERLESGRRS